MLLVDFHTRPAVGSSCVNITPGQLLAPAVSYHTIFTKIKVSPPLHLPPPWAPPAGIPLSFWSCWKESQGDLHPGKILTISSPPPILHSLNSDTTHLVPPIHKDIPPISFLLFIRTGPLKLDIWTFSIICRSKGSA